MKLVNFMMLSLLVALSAFAQAAEVAGKVGYMSGTLMAQRADGTMQVLGPKSAVLAGDILVTAKDSYAQIQMNDGTRLTLRPNSNLRIEAFQFDPEKPKEDNAAFRLLKGGFRTVTGLIGKRGDADAFKVRAASATIGIRGTDFTSRLCAAQNCQDEAPDQHVVKPAVNPSQVIGRVMLLQGELSAKDKAGKMRKIALGGPVYEGDQLTTGSKSNAVVAFRDEGRITLQENTVFHVEQFKYDKAAAQEGAVLRLVKGGVRVVTGLIGRTRHEDYQFHVANATIGIRGTGFDSWCYGPCAEGLGNPGATEGNPMDGAGVFVWSGEVALVKDCAGGVDCPVQIVSFEQAAIIARDSGEPVRIKLVPQRILNNDAPRPDGIKLDMEELFGAEATTGEAGLYVTVQDGHVILKMGDKSLDLGRSETGFAGENLLKRLASPPAFMGGEIKMDMNGGSSSSNGCMVQ